MESSVKLERPIIGIVTEGKHFKKTKMTHYRAVNLASGEVIFNRTVGNKTTCIGRFIAIVEAVKYLLRHPKVPRIIYSDSTTVIRWYYKKKAKASRECADLDVAIIFIKAYAVKIKDIQVLPWKSAEWGGNPANISKPDDM